MIPTLDCIETALDNIDFLAYVKFGAPLHRRKVAERIFRELQKQQDERIVPQVAKMGSPAMLHGRDK